MLIGINTLFLNPGKVGGSEIFIRNLIGQIAKTDMQNEYVIYVNKESRNIFSLLPKRFKLVICPFYASNKLIRNFWEQIILPIQCLLDRIDVLHSAGYTSPLITHCPKITTIFDLNYYFHPEDFTFFQLVVFKILIPLVAKSSDRIIVHSNKAKEEIVNVFKTNPGKIFVISGGVNDKFRDRYKTNEVMKVLNKYAITKPYILSTAVSYPHKNLKSLVLAYLNLTKNQKFKHKLVILGFAGKAQQELDRLLEENNLIERVILTGWVDPANMPLFYKGADLFVFPSLYEGFGLPLVEAMASGTPLIASNASCMPDIVGNGGLLVDATNVDSLTRSIICVLTNRDYTKKLALRGKKRSKLFSWVKLAKETVCCYESLQK